MITNMAIWITGLWTQFGWQGVALTVAACALGTVIGLAWRKK